MAQNRTISRKPAKSGSARRATEPPLSPTDLRLLQALQEDASQPLSALAERVRTSSSSCWRRIQALQENGVIRKHTIQIDARKVGLPFTVIASVKLAVPSETTLNAFERQVMLWPEVLECFTVTGAVDYVLRVVTTDIEAYDRFLRRKLLALGTVSDPNCRHLDQKQSRSADGTLATYSLLGAALHVSEWSDTFGAAQKIFTLVTR